MKEEEKQMSPFEVLWRQYDAFNYPKAEDIAKRHCKQGNPKWPTYTPEEWQQGIDQAKRRAKEMDLDTATRMLTEPQSLIRPVKKKENNATKEKTEIVRYEDGLLSAIDKANQEFNLNERNELMRHVCDASGIPNLQSLRSYMRIMRDGQ